MKYFVVSLSLAIFASGAALTYQPAQADTYTTKSVEEGPAMVVDSWMKPTVVRSRAIKDSDGTVTHVEEPLIMERHERVIVPTTETTTTTNVYQQPTVVQTEKRQVAYRSTTTKRKAASTRAKKRYHARKKAKSQVAQRRTSSARRSFVAQKVVNPTVVEQTEHSVHKETLIERRHPALDLY